MDTHTREAIVAAFDTRWNRDMRRMEGADGDAIAEEIAARFGVSSSEVHEAVSDEAYRLRSTL